MKNLLIWLCMVSAFLVSCKVRKSSSGDRDSDIMRVSAVPLKIIRTTTPTVFVGYPSYEFPEDSTHIRRVSTSQFSVDSNFPQYGTSAHDREHDFTQYCQDSIFFPKWMIDAGHNIDFPILIRFIVTDKGVIDSVSSYRQIESSIERNAMEAIKKSKGWKPAIRNGKPVSTIVYLPVNIRSVPIKEENKDTTGLDPRAPTIFVEYPSYEFPEDSTHIRRVNSQFSVDSLLPKYGIRGYSNEYNLLKYCQDSIVYPKHLVKAGVQARIIFRFIMTDRGEIDSVSSLSHIDPIAEESAMEAIKKFKGWKPAIRNGKPVSTTVYLPINFRLVPIRNNQIDSSHDTK